MMRKLEEYEQIGLIGYPGDGEYIAVLGDRERQNWLLGPCYSRMAGDARKRALSGRGSRTITTSGACAFGCP